MMAGLDNRNSTAVLAKTGGVLQVSNYMVGLSGGSWLVSSYVLSSCPTFEGESVFSHHYLLLTLL